MNGQKSNNVSRRNFLILVFSAVALAVFYISHFFNRKEQKYKVTDLSPDHKSGHRLRSVIGKVPDEIVHTKVLIVGAGISGLSAARKLVKAGMTDFKIMDLETKSGGNSSGIELEELGFPTGAHYLTIPNNDNTILIDFLKEINLVQVLDGKLKYDQNSLVHFPEERNFYQGRWHGGLIPINYFSEASKRDLSKFQKLMDSWKVSGLITIPIRNSNLSQELLALDKMTFFDYLKNESIISEEFLSFIDYSCRDDYGAGMKKISALAGIIYFTSRSPKHSDMDNSEYLTWNEGNQFLVNQFETYTQDKLILDSLVYQISKGSDGFESLVLQANDKVLQIKSDAIVLAIPYYVSERIVRIENFSFPSLKQKEYFPWVIINFVLKPMKEKGDIPICWDNVFYGSDSLGYINSNHQEMDRNLEKIVFTYYKCYSNENAKIEREKLMDISNEDLIKEAIQELILAYDEFESNILEVYICKRGHGMICPLPEVISTLYQNDPISTSLDGMYYAHSDASGFSVFEEAFNNGYEAAERTIKFLDK